MHGWYPMLHPLQRAAVNPYRRLRTAEAPAPNQIVRQGVALAQQHQSGLYIVTWLFCVHLWKLFLLLRNVVFNDVLYVCLFSKKIFFSKFNCKERRAAIEPKRFAVALYLSQIIYLSRGENGPLKSFYRLSHSNYRNGSQRYAIFFLHQTGNFVRINRNELNFGHFIRVYKSGGLFYENMRNRNS